MDLCCLLDNVEGGPDGKLPQHKASELVEKLGALIREGMSGPSERSLILVFDPSCPYSAPVLETDYTVMPLPKARIPIIKISRRKSSGAHREGDPQGNRAGADDMTWKRPPKEFHSR